MTMSWELLRAAAAAGFAGMIIGSGAIAVLPAIVFFVSLDDALHEVVTHHVAFVEMDDGDAFDFPDHVESFDQTGTPFRRQIDLRHIASDYGLGIKTQAREEHFHLLAGGILRF